LDQILCDGWKRERRRKKFFACGEVSGSAKGCGGAWVREKETRSRSAGANLYWKKNRRSLKKKKKKSSLT